MTTGITASKYYICDQCYPQRNRVLTLEEQEQEQVKTEERNEFTIKIAEYMLNEGFNQLREQYGVSNALKRLFNPS